MGFPIQVKTYNKFMGLRQDLANTSLVMDYANIALNCRFDQQDGVANRPGYSKFKEFDEAKILGLHQFKNAATSNLITCVDDKIYVNDTEVKDGQDNENYYSFAVLNEQAYIVNGVDTNLKYNKSTTGGSWNITNMCIANPIAHCTISATTTTGGSLTQGVYKYLYTYENSYTAQESNPYSLIAVPSASTGATTTSTVSLANIQCSNDAQVDKINIYRTTAGGSEFDAQYLTQINNTRSTTTSIKAVAIIAAGSGYSASDVLSINDGGFGTTATCVVNTVDGTGGITAVTVNTGTTNKNYWFASNISPTGGTGTGFKIDITQIVTTYTDTGSLALGDTIQLFHDPAPVFKQVVKHQNKIFGFQENSTILYSSYDFNGWYYPQALLVSDELDFRLEVQKDDGDYIRCIIPYINNLIIFKSNSIWVLEGYDESDFFLRQIKYDQNLGCVGHRGAIIKNNLCYFIDRSGVHVTDGNQITFIGAPVNGYFNDVNLQNDLPVDKTYLKDACIGSDSYKNISVIKFSFIPLGKSTHELHLVYDYDLNIWSVDNGYIGSAYCSYEENNVEYLLRGDDIGFVLKESANDYDGEYYKSTTTELLDGDELVDDEADWTVDLYKGFYVTILSGANYINRYRILSNTSDTLTIDGTFDDESMVNVEYIIGGFEFKYITGWDDYGNPGLTKRLKTVRPRLKVEKDVGLDIFNMYDFNLNTSIFRSTVLQAGLVYNNGVIWGNFTWGGVPIEEVFANTLVSEIHKYHAYGIRTFDPLARVTVNNYDKCFQIKGIGIR